MFCLHQRPDQCKIPSFTHSSAPRVFPQCIPTFRSFLLLHLQNNSLCRFNGSIYHCQRIRTIRKTPCTTSRVVVVYELHLWRWKRCCSNLFHTAQQGNRSLAITLQCPFDTAMNLLLAAPNQSFSIREEGYVQEWKDPMQPRTAWTIRCVYLPFPATQQITAHHIYILIPIIPIKPLCWNLILLNHLLQSFSFQAQ